MKRFLFSIAALALLSSPAGATPSEVDGASLVGKAKFSMLGFSLFDAAVYSESGRFAWTDEFALSLTYKRNAREDVLLNRTIRGMTERGAGNAKALAPLRQKLAACFSDVARGDRFTAVSTGPDSARFYLNGKESCTVMWPDFRRDFFGIWLDAKGGQAKLSAQLRGESS